jgi:uncharacterized SAM-binding protein YcdF (DUF218 family)
MMGLIISAGLERDALLERAADLWIVSDPLVRADAIVVLGGDYQIRPRIAAQLYYRGLANKILVSETPKSEQVRSGLRPSYTQLTYSALIRLGVPPDAIETFGKDSKNTRDEAAALRQWADHHAGSGFIIPTEIFTSRRVGWIFRREFFSKGGSIQVFSSDRPDYSRDDWWRAKQGRTDFGTEILKYIYYRSMY